MTTKPGEQPPEDLKKLTERVADALQRIYEFTSTYKKEVFGSDIADKSQFLKIAELLNSRGNKPLRIKDIVNATGIHRGSVAQVLNRTHKDSFISVTMPGYAKIKLWSLSKTGRGAAQLGKLGQREQEGLFGPIGEFYGVKGTDCCHQILKERDGEPLNALSLAREAIRRGYRGRIKGTEDEVLLTTAKSFWAAMSRDSRFKEVRALVYGLSQNAPP